MSRGFVKEGDQEEVSMVLPRAFLPKNVPNYVNGNFVSTMLSHWKLSTVRQTWLVWLVVGSFEGRV